MASKAEKENDIYLYKEILGMILDTANTASNFIPKVKITHESGSDDVRGNWSRSSYEREERKKR